MRHPDETKNVNEHRDTDDEQANHRKAGPLRAHRLLEGLKKMGELLDMSANLCCRGAANDVFPLSGGGTSVDSK